MKATLVTAFATAWLALGATAAPCLSHEPSDENDMIRPTETWDKTFPLSDKVHHSKVTFRNRWRPTSTFRKTQRARCRPSPCAGRSAR